MSKETIHSGHFMTSNPHTEIQGEDEDEDVEVDVVDVEGGVVGRQTDSGGKTVTAARVGEESERPVTYYKFGPHKAQSIAIDVSLNKLNKCIKVAYMKMTTPKWKDFKGLKLQWKHRIRLNNVIWRAYYMEFRKPDKKRRMPFNFFSVPDEDTTHSKIEGSVLEGMYWKRRMEAVCAQYKRWRTYTGRNRYAKRKLLRACCRKQESICACDTNAMQLPRPPQSQTPTGNSTFDNFDMDDDFDNEFTNQLFESLNAPFIFPNPKDGALGSCNANDLSIYQQPGLLSLQPSIEEIMSTADYYFPDEPGGCVQQQDQSQQPPQHHQFQDNADGDYGMGTPPQMVAMERKHSVAAAQPSASPPPNNHRSYSNSDYTTREYDVAMQLAVGFDGGGPVPQLQQPLYSQAAQYAAEQRSSVLSSPTRKYGTVDSASPGLTSTQSASSFARLSSTSPSQQGDQYTTNALLDRYMPRILAAVSGVPTSTGMQPLIGYSRANLQQQKQSMDASLQQGSTAGNEWLLNNLQQHSQQQILQQQQLQQQQQQQQAQFARPAVAAPEFLAPRAVPPSSGIQTTTNHRPATHLSTPQHHHSALPQQHPTTAHPFSFLHTTARTTLASNPIASIFPTPQQQFQQQQRMRTTNNTLAGADLSRYLPQPTLGSSISSGSAPAVSMASMMVPRSSSPFITGLAVAKPNYTQISPRLNPVETQQRLLAVASQKSTNPNNNFTSLQQRPTQQTPAVVQTVKPSQVFITRTPLTTSIAGPTAPSFIGNIYSNSNKGHDLSAPLVPLFKSASPSHSGAGKLSSAFRFPSVDQTRASPTLAVGVARPPTAPVFDSGALHSHISSPSAAMPLVQRRSTLQSPPQSNSTAKHKPIGGSVDANPIAPKRMKKPPVAAAGGKGKVSTTSAAPIYSPLTPPLQYTEIGGGNTGGGMVMGSPDAGAMDMSSPSSGTSGTAPGTSSSCSSASGLQSVGAGLTASELLLPLALAGRAVVKEEGEEREDSKPFSKSPSAGSGARRRQASAGAGNSSRASSRAAADSTLHPEERKRILHLHAEKNRRCALKDGFECLVDAVPAVEQAGVKSTNAVVLNRAAQHIRDLKDDADEKTREVEEMRERIRRTNEKITTLQANLPSNNRLNSAPSSSSNAPNTKCQLEQFFEHYAKERAKGDYRFWLMSEIFQKLLRSFASSIHPDAANREEVLASVRQWLERSWNSAALRPACTETLVRLATASGAINDDSSLPKYALNEVAKFSGSGGSSSSP